MQGKFIDLTGQKFGELTVLRRNGTTKGGKVLWFCECDCGNTKTVITSHLNSGKATSCGHDNTNPSYRNLENKKFGRLTVIRKTGDKQRDIKYLCECECGNTVEVEASKLISGAKRSCRVGCSNFKDLTGKKFGSWTVICRADDGKNGQPRYLCRCDCGSQRVVVAQSLRTGKSKSCGCKNREHNQEIFLCELHKITDEIFNKENTELSIFDIKQAICKLKQECENAEKETFSDRFKFYREAFQTTIDLLECLK